MALTKPTSEQITYLPAGTGASTDRTVQDKLRESVSVLDFGENTIPGITDMTVVFNKTISYINTNNIKKLTIVPGSYVVGRLDVITVDDFTLDCEGVVLISLPNSLVNAYEHTISVDADNFTMIGGTLDGNQANYTAEPSQAVALLGIEATGHKFNRVRFINSPGRGANISCSNSSFIDCNFDNNANLGSESVEISYTNFINCTWNSNGYGFKVSPRVLPADTQSTFLAFGNAFRYGCHHLTFDSCIANMNSREGFFLDSGCYAIKYNNCIAYGNDDGGFTTNSDGGASQYPSNALPCFDISYVNCEAYNNWSAGIVTTSPCNGLNVVGGNYYNNHRLAGTIPYAAAYSNGIFVAGNTKSANIVGARVYDDRQYCTITAASVTGSNCTITATGWIAGTKDYYPKVAIINNATNLCIGYGKIISESAGSVIIQTMPYNGVTLASISSAHAITQRVQHNGVFLSNGVEAYIDADIYGETPGPLTSYAGSSYEGFKVVQGATNAGQNSIINRHLELFDTQLLENPSFDADILNWTFALIGGGTATRNTTVKKSTASLQLIGGSSIAQGDAALISGYLANYLRGNYCKFGFWVNAVSRNDAVLRLYWLSPDTTASAGGYVQSFVTHPGGGWKYLELSCYIPYNVTDVICRIEANIGKTTYWDNGSFKAYGMKVSDTKTTIPARNTLLP